MLCFLAAMFAFEAKLAWFSPAGTSPAQISAGKLMPADATKLIAKAIAAQAATQHFSTEIALLLAVALLHVQLAMLAFCKPTNDGIGVYPSASFSPPLFRRPPPQS